MERKGSEVSNPSRSRLLRPTIAVIHPYIWRGGSEACALWAIEALKKEYEVTLITSSDVDINQLNGYYGTNLRPQEFSVIKIPVPIPLRWIKGFFMIRYFRLYRYCRRQSNKYDVMFSSYNPIDFGGRGIQYILDPNFNRELLNKIAGYPKGLRGLFYKGSIWRWFYEWIARCLIGNTIEGLQNNYTFVDSDWTGQLTQEYLNIKTTTVYPPVVTSFKVEPWNIKESGFVCIGRINPEKKIEKIIQIIEELNNRGFKLHLHIIGTVGNFKYLKSLIKIAAGKSWIFFEINISFSQKIKLISSHRYGIHGRENEPFGIAVAEMVRAGCLVWVPNGGGQVEIVKRAELTYNTCEDAVDKISGVLMNNYNQGFLLRHLRRRATQFTTDIYMKKISKGVNSFLADKMLWKNSPRSTRGNNCG